MVNTSLKWAKIGTTKVSSLIKGQAIYVELQGRFFSSMALKITFCQSNTLVLTEISQQLTYWMDFHKRSYGHSSPVDVSTHFGDPLTFLLAPP